jgi:hypothetical protein
VPTVAVSSQIASTVYMVAVIGLAVLLARPVYLVYSGSQERSAQVLAAGLGALFDSMSPGTSVVTHLETYPGVPLTVALGGDSVTVHLGEATASSRVRWALPSETLSAGASYNFSLDGGQLAVGAARNG